MSTRLFLIDACWYEGFLIEARMHPPAKTMNQPERNAAVRIRAAALLIMAALFGGCSTTPSSVSRERSVSFIPGAQRPPAALFEKCRALNLAPTDDLLCVSVGQQRLRWYRRSDSSAPGSYALRETFVCSTSKYGIGQKRNSYRTPLGLHRVKEKIGAGMPIGTIFKSRRAVGFTWRDDPDAGITTRILWLDGLEPGFNRGGNVDTHDRYVYIHGTGDQSSIARPASHGCVHLGDRDLVRLFDNTPSGAMVWIAEE